MPPIQRSSDETDRMTPEEYQATLDEIARLRQEMWRLDDLMLDVIVYSGLVVLVGALVITFLTTVLT